VPAARANPPAAAGTRSCACGGSCPKCHAAQAHGGLRLSQTGDALERQADAAAARAVGGETGPFPLSAATPAAMRAPSAAAASRQPPESLRGGLRSTGQPLDAHTRRFMESRFGRDLGHVRVHGNAEAARSAHSIGARAYAFGSDIVFGAGHYAPGTTTGRRLLAHELAHVLQQGSGAAPQADLVQRAPTIGVVDKSFIGPLAANQRRAAASCPIDCCDQPLGTLHTMPLFFHESRGAIVAAGSPRATGIGAELHFVAAGSQPAAGELCHCDDFHMIQIITSTHPEDPRGRSSFVDNDPAGTSPFYGAPAGIGRSGHGEHAIPGGYADAGQRVTTTESIYDRPYRTHAMLGGTSLSWRAETCVSCVKNSEPDRILGCTTYGFTQNFNPGTRSFDPVQQIAPGCRARASSNFFATLSTDPTTTGYDAQAAPGFIECKQPGDFPPPSGDTRFA
jgi:hypothetical protein